MKKIIVSVIVACIVSLGCKRDRIPESIKPADPAPVNSHPVARAGNDTSIMFPANRVLLNGSGSYDPDNNIASYHWSKLSGPGSFNIVNANSAQTQATNLAEGVYQFELTVTDFLGLSDKDSTTVTVNKINVNEIIFKDLIWQCWWGCWVEIPNLYSHIPVGILFRVFIKRDNSNTWEEAIYGSQTSYGFLVDTSLLVYNGGSAIGGDDTPDIKIIY